MSRLELATAEIEVPHPKAQRQKQSRRTSYSVTTFGSQRTIHMHVDTQNRHGLVVGTFMIRGSRRQHKPAKQDGSMT